MQGKRRCFAITQQGGGQIYNLEKKPGVELCDLVADGILEMIPAEAVPVKLQNRDPQSLPWGAGKSGATEASENINIDHGRPKFGERSGSSVGGVVGMAFPGIPLLGTMLNDHMMTAEESVKAPQSSVQNYQEPIFLARSLLAPFKEEPAVDQIRDLLIQYIINGNLSAAMEAGAITNALSERIRSKIESDRTMRYDQYSSGILRSLDSLNGVVNVFLRQSKTLAVWSGVAKGESSPTANAPQFKRDSAAITTPTPYIGPGSGQLIDCLGSSLQRGEVIFDGLPEGSLNLRYDTNSLTVETVPGPSGYQRLIFRSIKPQPVFCVRASWSLN